MLFYNGMKQINFHIKERLALNKQVLLGSTFMLTGLFSVIVSSIFEIPEFRYFGFLSVIGAVIYGVGMFRD